MVFNVLQFLISYSSISSPSLTHFFVAFQQHRDDLCLIPMKYGDSLSEPPSSSRVFEPQTCPATNPRDSESYGSLHSDDQSESGVPDQLKDTDEFGFTGNNMGGSDSDSHVDTEEQQVITGAVETNSQSRQTRTRFCVIL